MPSFADSFWSGDYAGGMGVLFDKLHQGVVENEQVLTIARMRADAEEAYAKKLGDIAITTDKMTGGFARDDGASLRKAYEGVRTETLEASKSHRKIASNISELVILPFGRWCAAHEHRVHGSQDDLAGRMRAHDRQADSVQKLRSTYFNKCRLVEDMEEENKLGFQPPAKGETSPKGNKTSPPASLPEIVETPAEEPVEIGDETYEPTQVKMLLMGMLNTVKVGETKVPILGIYQNTSSGADIVEFVQRNMGASSVTYAEQVGQDLISNGFLRLVGNVGSSFANSSKMHYQWRPKAFQMAGIPEKKGVDRASTVSSLTSVAGLESPTAMNSMGEMLQKWNPLDNPYPNELPTQRLTRERNEADEKYKAGVRKLDLLRCNLEEAMIDHFKFMEKCELDRLKAIKAVLLDFSGALSNVIPAIQSSIDNMMLYQESIQPLGDVRYLIENYRTGTFVPKVQTYDNYYNKVDEQTFGVDLEARARQDRKRVPLVVTTILTFLDSHYPDLEGDEARRSVWTVDVPLAATHHLRNIINTGKPIPNEILQRYEIPIVASALRLYFLELPDSLVSSQVYEIMKTIYTSPESSSNAETRVSVLQNTLGQLRLANIATLDAITTHLTRLVDLTSADEAFVQQLAQSLAPCVLRPRIESHLTIHERHPVRLVRDLFEHKEAIFGELKRASSHNLTNPLSMHQPMMNAHRDRATSGSDEHNRRAAMEERARAIAHRSRASSPAPMVFQNGQRHRRDRSVGSEHTRFPVVGSPTVAAHGTGGGGTGSTNGSEPGTAPSPLRSQQRSRRSLEVPESAGGLGNTAESSGLASTTAAAGQGSGSTSTGREANDLDSFAPTFSATGGPIFDAGPSAQEAGFSNSTNQDSDVSRPSSGTGAGTIITKSLPQAPVSNGISEHAIPSSLATGRSGPNAGAQHTGHIGEPQQSGFGGHAGFGGHEAASGIEKADPLGRAGHVASAANRFNRKAAGSVGSGSLNQGERGAGGGLAMIGRAAAAKRDSTTSLKRDSASSLRSLREREAVGLAEQPGRGVQLEDRPMDD